MRTNLQGCIGWEMTFTGIFWRYGTYCNRRGAARTILLKSVRDLNGRELADHVWINYTAGFDAIGEFYKGDLVQFEATVSEYVKGYQGERIEIRLKHPPQIDYRLKYPRKVKLLQRNHPFQVRNTVVFPITNTA